MRSAETGWRMRSLVAFACAAALLASCARKAAPAAARPARPSHMQTIDSTPPKLATLQPPPVLTDEAPPPKSTINVIQADAPPPPTPQDEAVRAALPFAPAIALDPVDGSKISIRATTPTYEIKGHVFYFTSEENKKTFAANPQQFLKGAFNFKL